MLDELTDSQLLSLVREGNLEAWGILYSRYRMVATKLARHMDAEHHTDDVVSKAFISVYQAIENGSGPTDDFQRYLLSSVKHEVYRVYKDRRRIQPTDQVFVFDSVVLPDDSWDPYDHRMRTAWASLSTRHKKVLTETVIHGRKPSEVAAEFGLTANGVSALSLRAKNLLLAAYESQTIIV